MNNQTSIRNLAILFSVMLCGHGRCSEDLIVSATAPAELLGQQTFSRVVLESGAELRIKETSDRKRAGILGITADTIEVRSDSTLNASQVIGEIPSEPDPADDYGGNGGGYGGKGGAPTPEEQLQPYGSSDLPSIMRGTFGVSGPGSLSYGGFPGGALTIRGNSVDIQGNIEADGGKGEDWANDPTLPEPQRYFAGGGASGGGILILARHLTLGPNARITANGGNGGEGRGINSCQHGYPGGGGRIKIFYEEGIISPVAVVECKKGAHPNPLESCGGDGGVEDGTIHIQQVRSIEQLLNPGDLNNDGITNHEDLFILQQSWLKTVTPVPTPDATPTP